MKFEQVFYGRGPNGYCVLGASVDEQNPIRNEIVLLCGSVGNPRDSRHGRGCPFLMQLFKGRLAYMVCGRPGPLDGMSRDTLFFHALVADADELRASGVSAVDCLRKQLFMGTLPDGEIKPVSVDDGQLREGRDQSPVKIKLPAVVSCRWEDNLRVLELLGDEVVGTNWSTFSWEKMTGFQVYGLDPWKRHLELHKDVSTYDVLGCPFPRVSAPAEKSPETACLPGPREDTSRVSPDSNVCHRAMVMVCLCAGLVLGWALGFGAFWVKRGGGVDQKRDSVQFRAFRDELNCLQRVSVDMYSADVTVKGALERMGETGILLEKVRRILEVVDKYFPRTAK